MPSQQAQSEASSSKPTSRTRGMTVRFSGDSGDGMQLTGDQFTDTSAIMGNDFATLPDYPAEIRAPAGTLPGVSSFQIQFSESVILTPGDVADVLVAMNPAALRVDVAKVRQGGMIIVNEDVFDEANLLRANWSSNPLKDETLKDYHVVKVPLSELTKRALKDSALKLSEVQRCKNFYALGIVSWMFDRELGHTVSWIQKKFGKRPDIMEANITALKAGYSYADVTEAFLAQRPVGKAKLPPGTYRKITGNEATAIGLITAAVLADKTLFYGSYPITPASNILHELARHHRYGVKTFQAEDEIAAIGAAIGAAFGGQLGVCGTSGPGMCLKAEALGLAIVAELPLVVINVQRAGPSTGMPTKTEQADLLQALFGRHGESPVAVMAPMTPSDCFEMAIEAVRIAVSAMTPVILLSDGYLANAAEPWQLPDLDALPHITVTHPRADGKKPFLPYARDAKTLARPWAVPGTPGLEHRLGGLAKADRTGNVSYDPVNNQHMVDVRAEKIKRIADRIPDAVLRGPASGKLLVVGWGGTFGTISQAVTDLEQQGVAVSHVQIKYLNPFPNNLGSILKRFETILIPELNMGQLLLLLRDRYPGSNLRGYHKVQGQPFHVDELVDQMKAQL